MQFEYKIIEKKLGGFMRHVDPSFFESDLNNLGDNGWEIVSCIPIAVNAGMTRSVVVILKRPR